MDMRIQNATAELSQTVADAEASFGDMTSDQLNWKPAGKSWSVAQCLDHIIKTNHEFDSELEKLATGTRVNSFWEQNSPFSGWAGRWLINVVLTDSKKAKAPTNRIVPPSDIDADIISRFVSEVDEVKRKVAACEGSDADKTVVTSPFLPIMTYKLSDALTVLVEHTKRHIRQAKRVVEAEGFPRKRATAPITEKRPVVTDLV